VAVLFAAIWAVAAWAILRWPVWPVQAAGAILIGAVVQALVILMHEGVHGNLFRRDGLDRWVGFLLGAPGLFSCAAYRTCHLLHHRYNRSPKDPDEFANLSRSRRVVSAAFYGWLVVGVVAYLVHVPLTAIWRGTPRQRRAVAVEYVLLALLYGGTFLAAWRFGFLEAVLRCWIVPLAVAVLFGGVRGWAEHAMTRPGHPLTQTRTVTSNGVVSFFMCNLNYHLEHHLHPAMPWYNLPRLHELLGDEYRRAGSFVYRSYLRFMWDAFRVGVHGTVPPILSAGPIAIPNSRVGP
jgi:fatty acid desaturase